MRSGGGGAPADDPATFSERERRHLENRSRFRAEGTGYGMIQSTRPQTLAYALTDSPAGQLAWIAEKFHEWSGGHFAALEVPDLLVEDVRAFFRPLR